MEFVLEHLYSLLQRQGNLLNGGGGAAALEVDCARRTSAAVAAL